MKQDSDGTGLFGLGESECLCGRIYSVEPRDRGTCCICVRDTEYTASLGVNWPELLLSHGTGEKL